MSEDATQDEQQEEAPLPHDGIVRRLLEYQARLREGIKAEESEAAPAAALIDYFALDVPTAVQVEEIVDVAAAEAVVEIETAGAGEIVRIPEPEGTEAAPALASAAATATPVAQEELVARVTRLEAEIMQIASSLAELRIQAQNGALAIDDRLAEVIEKLDATVPPPASDISS